MKSAKSKLGFIAVLSIFLLSGCGNNKNNGQFGIGNGSGFFGGNCNGVPIQSAIPFRVDGGYLSGNNFVVGARNSPFGNTGQVSVGSSSGGNQRYETDPRNSVYGTMQVSLTAQYNGGRGGRATGGGSIQLSSQVIQHLMTLYGNGYGYGNGNGNGYGYGNGNGNGNGYGYGNNQQITVCVTGMVINLGVSSTILRSGARKLYGGNVHLFLNNGNRYSLGF